ncbi:MULTISPECIES: apolipoprotein N-acyltransferase [unclassified Iodidimonas]|uniref:apolipoprotein N-acyltransferase n=1 Tax=unclassified Iodidimonas TaxID=2626145 RepID=UPI0024828274|nr:MULTISPECIES: apolipoprotein N-acyltransferase [unclassified Iodidimonas]
MGRWAVLFLLGALSSFAFAPFYILPVLWISFPLFLLIVMGADRGRGAFIDGWFFGFGAFAIGLRWIVQSFANQPSVPDAMGPPAVLLLAAVLALYPALAAALSWRFAPKGPLGLVFFALAFILMEWLRGHLFTGFPWNPISAIWTVWTPMMQPLALIGPYGLGFLTMMLILTPLGFSPRFRGRRLWFYPALMLVLLIIWGGYGMWRLDQHPTKRDGTITVRLVQANIPQKQKWDRALRRAHFADYLALSDGLPPPEGRLLVIWPETAITDPFFDRSPGGRALVARMLPDDGILLAGSLRVEASPDAGQKAYNSLFAFDSKGGLPGFYDKHHLVPFGEYLPARGLLSALGLEKLAGGMFDISKGPGPQTLAIEGLPVISPLICYEVIFPGALRPRGGEAGLLVNITNDAWFGMSSGPHQHFAQSRMRAVEQGLPLLRSAGTGISAVVDPLGRVLTEIRLGQRGVSDSALPLKLDGKTTYARIGDWPLWIGLIGVVLFLMIRKNTRFAGF